MVQAGAGADRAGERRTRRPAPGVPGQHGPAGLAGPARRVPDQRGTQASPAVRRVHGGLHKRLVLVLPLRQAQQAPAAGPALAVPGQPHFLAVFGPAQGEPAGEEPGGHRRVIRVVDRVAGQVDLVAGTNPGRVHRGIELLQVHPPS